MKRIVKIMIAGLCVGLPLLFVKIAFQIPEDVFWRFYLSCAGIVLIGMAAFNVFYNRRYLKKMKAAVQLLENNCAEEYIAEVESMCRRAKGRFANSMLTINLSAGYCELKQYDKAIELLESISDVRMSGDLKVVHRLNLCLCYFYQKQTDCAMMLYENSQRIFDPYRNGKLHGGSIAVLDIYAAIGAKDYARAVNLLKTARSKWDDPRFIDDYRYLEENIHQSQTE